jgi:lipopolysaccharide heptosyltransferase I
MRFVHIPKKILIIKPSSFGDIVHSLPFLNAVKTQYPFAELHWIAARGLHHFLQGHSMIDKILIMDKNRWKQLSRVKSTVPEIFRFCKRIYKENYDVAVDLSGLLRSGLITLVSRAPYRLGFEESDEGSPFFYSHKIFGDMSTHAIDRYLKLAAFMGCDTSEIRYPFAPYDPLPPICKSLPKVYGVIAPSAGKLANRWPEDRFGKLARRLPIPSVIISSASDSKPAQSVRDRAGDNAVSLAGKTSLKQLIPIIENACYFISNDTGPMHIAAAVNTPVFAIFGPANPDRTGPYGDNHTLIRQPLECSPCYRKTPCEHWRCMLDLSVEYVYTRIMDRLRKDMPELLSL